MEAFLNQQLWTLLSSAGLQQKTVREWDELLGKEGREEVPLRKVDGARADFIRCPETGMRLELHENWDGSFSALPPADTEIDSRIDGLSLEDLLLYEVDWLKLLQGVQTKWGLSGEIRVISNAPPMWDIGFDSPHSTVVP